MQQRAARGALRCVARGRCPKAVAARTRTSLSSTAACSRQRMLQLWPLPCSLRGGIRTSLPWRTYRPTRPRPAVNNMPPFERMPPRRTLAAECNRTCTDRASAAAGGQCYRRTSCSRVGEKWWHGRDETRNAVDPRLLMGRRRRRPSRGESRVFSSDSCSPPYRMNTIRRHVCACAVMPGS